MHVNEFMTTTTASTQVTVWLWLNDGLARCTVTVRIISSYYGWQLVCSSSSLCVVLLPAVHAPAHTCSLVAYLMVHDVPTLAVKVWLCGRTLTLTSFCSTLNTRIFLVWPIGAHSRLLRLKGLSRYKFFHAYIHTYITRLSDPQSFITKIQRKIVGLYASIYGRCLYCHFWSMFTLAVQSNLAAYNGIIISGTSLAVLVCRLLWMSMAQKATGLCTLKRKKQLVRPLRKSTACCWTARKCKFVVISSSV